MTEILINALKPLVETYGLVAVMDAAEKAAAELNLDELCEVCGWDHYQCECGN